jgi:hypothetical protein
MSLNPGLRYVTSLVLLNWLFYIVSSFPTSPILAPLRDPTSDEDSLVANLTTLDDGFVHGVCRIHLKQVTRGGYIHKWPVYLGFDVYDGANTEVFHTPSYIKTTFGGTVTIPADQLPMRYHIEIHVGSGNSVTGWWMNWPLKIQIGEHLTNMDFYTTDRSKLPHCVVEGWRNAVETVTLPVSVFLELDVSWVR